MPPVLSLHSIPGQTARHNSRALSMNPPGLHVAGCSDPAFSSESGAGADSVKLINLSNIYINMQADENSGEYLNLKDWELLEINRKTDSRGRIHAGEKYYGSEIKVFISEIDQDPEKCKNYLLLPKSVFTEIRKSRAKDKIGEPLTVQKNGDIWTTQKDKYAKIFVRKQHD